MGRTAAQVQFPSRRDTAQQRGIALQYWLQEHGYTHSAFARESGLARPYLARYLEGAHDLANASQDVVERLLGVIGMSDSEARAYFGIPDSSAHRWRTFRPPPLGHGNREETPETMRVLPLNGKGLRGEMMVPHDSPLMLVVDRAVTTGLIVTQHDGAFWVIRQEGPGGPAYGEFQGGFHHLTR